MELALEALKKARRKILTTEECHATITLLDKALKQEQDESVARVHTFFGPEWAVVQVLGEFDIEDELYTHPQPKQEQGEPVMYCEIHHLTEPCVQCTKEHEGYKGIKDE